MFVEIVAFAMAIHRPIRNVELGAVMFIEDSVSSHCRLVIVRMKRIEVPLSLEFNEEKKLAAGIVSFHGHFVSRLIDLVNLFLKFWESIRKLHLGNSLCDIR